MILSFQYLGMFEHWVMLLFSNETPVLCALQWSEQIMNIIKEHSEIYH